MLRKTVQGSQIHILNIKSRCKNIQGREEKRKKRRSWKERGIIVTNISKKIQTRRLKIIQIGRYE